MNHNFKTHGINKAKEAFNKDLQQDKQFIEHKQKASEYGTINASYRVFTLDTASSCESLITSFQKTQN